MTDARNKQTLPRGTQCERVDWLEGLFRFRTRTPAQLSAPSFDASLLPLQVFVHRDAQPR